MSDDTNDKKQCALPNCSIHDNQGTAGRTTSRWQGVGPPMPSPSPPQSAEGAYREAQGAVDDWADRRNRYVDHELRQFVNVRIDACIRAVLLELEKAYQQSNVCIDGDCGRIAAHCEEHFTLAWDHNEYIKEKRIAALEGILRGAPESPSRYRKGAKGAWLDYARQSAEWLTRARGVLGEGK